MRIYLDNCCFNRPYDDQRQLRIRLESEAIVLIQMAILSNKVELAWSYLMDYENAANPNESNKRSIERWKYRAVIEIRADQDIEQDVERLRELGLGQMDSLHVACAIAAECVYFITTDDRVLKRAGDIRKIKVMDPETYVRETNLC